MGEFAVSVEHSEAKSVSASRGKGTLPLDPAGGSAPDPPYRLALRALAMTPLDCGPPAGGKLTNWPAVSKRVDSTDLWSCHHFSLVHFWV